MPAPYAYGRANSCCGAVTKADALRACEAAALITGLEIDEISIQIFETTAIVRGRTRATAGGGAPADVTLWFTDVFIRRDGQCRVVASRATRIGP